MAKTLRVQEAEGWVTKDPETIPENRLSPAEIDDNFLAMEEQHTWMGGFKNRIINGNFGIWQRSTAATSTTGYQSADRWLISASHNIPVLRRTGIDLGDTCHTQSLYCLRVNSTADAVAGAYQVISQRIENVRTFAGKKAVLTFWGYCTTDRDIAISFRQYFGTGTLGESIRATVNFNGDIKKVAVTDSWQKYTVVVDVPDVVYSPFSDIGSYNTDYLQVMFWFSAGSDFDDDTDSLGHQTGQFYLADIQFERGDVATEFERRPLSVEALLCYRYYWKKKIGQVNANAYADNAIVTYRFWPPVPMRTIPTAASVFTGATLSYVDGLTWDVLETDESNGGLFYFLANTVAARTNVYLKFGADDYVALSAEL